MQEIFSMKLFAFVISLFMMQISAQGQFKGPSPLISDRPLSKVASPVSQSTKEAEQGDDRILAARAIAALKRLDYEVLLYRSLGDFEADGRLARVPFEVFKNDLEKAMAEVEPILSRLPQSRLKIEIGNTLDSYRDGAFWWQRIHQERVVNVSAMTFAETSRTSSDAFFASTIPYTVAIHWRQAARYLKRSEELMNGKKR
jgi:hypothetical protein